MQEVVAISICHWGTQPQHTSTTGKARYSSNSISGSIDNDNERTETIKQQQEQQQRWHADTIIAKQRRNIVVEW